MLPDVGMRMAQIDFFCTGSTLAKKEFSMFLPMTREEAAALGWDELDVILVTGDAINIDSPYFGVAIIGKVLLNAGYRVGIIPSRRQKPRMTLPGLASPVCFGVLRRAVSIRWFQTIRR